MRSELGGTLFLWVHFVLGTLSSLFTLSTYDKDGDSPDFSLVDGATDRLPYNYLRQ